MRTGVSLPFGDIENGSSELTKPVFLRRLRECKVGSVELRAVRAGENPKKVLVAARVLWKYGFAVTVHGSISSVGTAVHDLLDPLEYLLREMRQRELIVVAHPPAREGLTEMLKELSDEIIRRNIPVRIALENNRLMPPDCEDRHGDCAELVASAVCECGRDNIGICFDMGHYYYHAAGQLGDRDALPDSRFLSHVIHTHIHATHELTTHFPLDDRFELPLQSYISALGHEYEGQYNIELEPHRFAEFTDAVSAVLGSVKYLEKNRELQENAPCVAERKLYGAFSASRRALR